MLSALLAACDSKPADNARAPKTNPNTFRTLTIGDSAPAYNIATFAGDTVHIGRANEPITVMNIWATWCASCREELADLEALHKEFSTRGVRVLAVSVDETDAARVRKFIESEKLTFSVAHDIDGRVQQLYQVVGIPQTFVVGRFGRIVWKSAGTLHGVADSLRRLLKAL